ncbi:MAG TPA: MinD/ParA family protein [Limnochordales bacterium]
MSDQAESLRRLVGYAAGRAAAPAPSWGSGGPGRLARVLAVTSGKGGVGKTNLAVNLCLALRELGQEVALVDADLGLANADLLWGVVPRYHLGDVAAGNCSVSQALVRAPGGVHLLAGASGLAELADADPATLRRLLEELRALDRMVDLVVVDTGAGIARQVMDFLGAAREVLLVVTPEPTSLTDAYSLVKVASSRYPSTRWYTVVNMAGSQREGALVAERLASVARRFLSVELVNLGWVPRDDEVSRAVMRQVPLLLCAPRSAAAGAIRAVAQAWLGVPARPGTGLAAALRRLLSWRSSRGAGPQPPIDSTSRAGVTGRGGQEGGGGN